MKAVIHNKHRLSAVAAVTALMSVDVATAHAADNVVTEWNKVLLQAVRDTNPGPPMVARMLAISHTCMYDAWAAYDPIANGTQFEGELRRPVDERTDDNKREAISFAAFRAAVDLFPGQKSRFTSFMATLGYDPANNDSSLSSPAAVGRVACAAVLEDRHRDGANQLGDLSPGAYSDYTNYKPVNTSDRVDNPNRWQPLAVPDGRGGLKAQNFLAPHWGRVKPFAIRDVNQFKLKPPAPYGSKKYIEQAEEVIHYSANLTDKQKVVAEYWADGPRSETPPGHWNLFAQFVSERDQHGLDDDAKLFFSLNNALLDASIWAWSVKVKYDYIRPISAIHYLFQGQVIHAWAGRDLGTQPILGEQWRPYQAENFVTPPFAEFVSGHSTFSSAAAQVLRNFTNSDAFGYTSTVAAGSSFVEPGTVPAKPVQLSWGTFTAAANEAGLSRLYGGIHFRDGDMYARRVGGQIGQQVWKKSQALFQPKKKK
ncbi:vanadium-dependent haloperoxidase [Allohahella sp. A8]|uniref:vanadium-dependent haloperoxidase n=1 Tax=Allohahella sp. A8 TaxID=3141461 RepID=UPI003A8103BD